VAHIYKTALMVPLAVHIW